MTETPTPETPTPETTIPETTIPETDELYVPDVDTVPDALVEAAALLDSFFILAEEVECNVHLAMDARSGTLTVMLSDGNTRASLTRPYDGDALVTFCGMVLELQRAYVSYSQTGRNTAPVMIEQIGNRHGE